MVKQDSSIGGSKVMYPAVPTDHDAFQPLVPTTPYVVGAPGPFTGAPPRGPDILHSALDQTWLVNCLRRRWLAALLLGLLAALLAGLLLLWLFPLSSEVVSYLQVENQETDNIFEETKRVTNPKEFEVFQQTQLTLFKSQFVLTSALARSDISQLNAVVKERPNELQWLMDELQVSFPGESKIMMVKYEGDDDPEEMKKIIDAVVDAYKNEVVTAARISRKELHAEMGKLHREVLDEIAEKGKEVERLTEELGGAESPNVSAELNILAREVALIQQQIIDTKESRAELEVNLELQKRQATSETALNEAIEEELDKDPTMQGYKADQYTLTSQLRQLEAVTKQRATPQIKQLRAQLKSLLQDSQGYRMRMEQEMRQRWRSMPNEALQMVITEYIMRRNQLQQQLEDLQNQLDEKYNQIEALGQQDSDLAIKRAEVEQLQEIEHQMNWKLRSWKVEDDASEDQIKVMQKAFSTEQINIYERWSIAGVGSVAAFCLMCYGVALIEFRNRRLNSPEDIDEGLGIRVLGVLPSVASRKAMAPGSTTAAQLSESIDNVRATLMHDSTSRPRQIVLVASPSSMEGSTTVASHLALSLTRAGRRTLLVDGDLRDPSLHKLFGMPLDDGLSELLRSEIEVADAIRPTSTEGLWLLTAGLCDVDSVHALATDQLQPIFDKLRSEFDFIIIDGAPFLGLSDSLSIGQHVDGAVLTVLRDQSGVRNIYQASELLKSLGIRLIGCVVNGMPFKADRRIMRLNGSGPRNTKRLPASNGQEE